MNPEESNIRATVTVGVLINVWGGDNPSFFRDSLSSLTAQTVAPDEVVLVVDGPINAELEDVIREFDSFITSIVRHDKPRGLADSRNSGLQNLTAAYAVLQDADDLSHRQRIESVVAELEMSPSQITVLSSPMLEFSSSTRRIIGVRPGPSATSKLTEQLRRINPINHPTVVLHRESMLRFGPYQKIHKLEDYATWASLSSCPHIEFALIDTPLVGFRVTDAYLKRRGGWELAKSELQLQRLLRTALPRPPAATDAVRRLAYTTSPPSLRSLLARRYLSNSSLPTMWTSIDDFLSSDLTKNTQSRLLHLS